MVVRFPNKCKEVSLSINLTDQEFHDLGFAVDPDDPSRAILATRQDESVPDDTWDLDRLGNYARTGLDEADRLQRESLQLGRRSTVQIFRAGRAISIARKKVKAAKWGEWGQWLAQHGLKRTTAWEAAALFERAGSEEAIKNLTPDQAKRKYNITRDRQNGKPKNSQATSLPRTSGSESGSSTEDAFDDGDDFDADDDLEPFDDPEPEPDQLAKPPRSTSAMLAAVTNLLCACDERLGEMDEDCREMLGEILTVVARLLAKLSGAIPIERAPTDAISTSDTEDTLPALPLLKAANEALLSTGLRWFDAIVAEINDNNNHCSKILAQLRSKLERSGDINALGDSPSDTTQSR
jgi:hypothetical protein